MPTISTTQSLTEITTTAPLKKQNQAKALAKNNIARNYCHKNFIFKLISPIAIRKVLYNKLSLVKELRSEFTKSDENNYPAIDSQIEIKAPIVEPVIYWPS